jgi:hypothetical protein
MLEYKTIIVQFRAVSKPPLLAIKAYSIFDELERREFPLFCASNRRDDREQRSGELSKKYDLAGNAGL